MDGHSSVPGSESAHELVREESTGEREALALPVGPLLHRFESFLRPSSFVPDRRLVIRRSLDASVMPPGARARAAEEIASGADARRSCKPERRWTRGPRPGAGTSLARPGLMPRRALRDVCLLPLRTPASLAATAALVAFPVLASRPASPAEDVRRTGVIRGWRLESDGALFVLLESQGTAREEDREEQDPRDAPRVWFRTPPEKDVNTRFSDLALAVVLAATAPGAEPLPITVTAKLERALSGATPQEALPLSALEHP
jgi:hypothetical protein